MRIWTLGAPDPEMEAIERLLREAGETVMYATRGGQRVTASEAYSADGPVVAQGVTAYWVECAVPGQPLDWGLGDPSYVVVVDHHRPGDPGYGRPPEQFFPASSLGQVVEHLSRLGRWAGAPIDRLPKELVLTAASDHCPAAAYRGECPGVDPEALMRWRVDVRAGFQGRSVEQLLADVKAAMEIIREAPRIVIGEQEVADLRPAQARTGKPVPEAPEASLRLGIPIFCGPLVERDGRRKFVLLGAAETCVRAFLDEWAPAHGLTGLYGDPARGFAGGFAGEK